MLGITSEIPWLPLQCSLEILLNGNLFWAMLAVLDTVERPDLVKKANCGWGLHLDYKGRNSESASKAGPSASWSKFLHCGHRSTVHRTEDERPCEGNSPRVFSVCFPSVIPSVILSMASERKTSVLGIPFGFSVTVKMYHQGVWIFQCLQHPLRTNALHPGRFVTLTFINDHLSVHLSI